MQPLVTVNPMQREAKFSISPFVMCFPSARRSSLCCGDAWQSNLVVKFLAGRGSRGGVRIRGCWRVGRMLGGVHPDGIPPSLGTLHDGFGTKNPASGSRGKWWCSSCQTPPRKLPQRRAHCATELRARRCHCGRMRSSLGPTGLHEFLWLLGTGGSTGLSAKELAFCTTSRPIVRT